MYYKNPGLGIALGFSTGNTKVGCPVFSVGAALDCPSQKWCKFSGANYGAAGMPQCYAQRAEVFRPGVLRFRRRQEENLRVLDKHPSWSPEVARDLAALVYIKTGAKYMRLNESSDVASWNLRFLCQFSSVLRDYGIQPFMYTKTKNRAWIAALRSAGAVVLESETDFVAIKSHKEARALGLKLCPGEGCGTSCLRCPLGLKSAVFCH
jgi:hypothetical protein